MRLFQCSAPSPLCFFVSIIGSIIPLEVMLSYAMHESLYHLETESYKFMPTGAGEMTQYLTVLAILPNNLGSISNTLMVASNNL